VSKSRDRQEPDDREETEHSVPSDENDRHDEATVSADSAATVSGPPLDGSATEARLPSSIGPYTILGKLGEGGWGSSKRRSNSSRAERSR